MSCENYGKLPRNDRRLKLNSLFLCCLRIFFAVGVLRFLVSDGTWIRPRHHLLSLRHPPDAAGAARYRRGAAVRLARLTNTVL